MKNQHNDLFIIIQPLQYLQALELKKTGYFNTLVVLGSNKKSQLHSLVKEDDWDRIVWLSYNGTFLDIIQHRKAIKVLLDSFTHLNEIFVSSFYNEFMNMIVNYFPKNSRVLLEDGTANLLIDSSTRYATIKFRLKNYLCKLFGYNVSPINEAKIFTVFKPNSGKVPKIATEVIVNEYRKLRAELCSFKVNDEIYFVSSAFISCGMISKEDYMEFLSKLAYEYSDKTLNIILHRFDNLADFYPLSIHSNVNVIASTGPIELYFIDNKINPYKVITAGSGATESLKLIYGINIDIIMPNLRCFNKKWQREMDTLALHFKESHTVRFI
mgnify:CR=1 FL=1|tara:strand:- start:10753 stop:11730 length:978 start_codon:yes stop_codon:yes gene_type:complete